MNGLETWLAGTGLAQALRDTPWVIPAVQCVHIGAIAILFVSSLVGQLRLAGLLANDVDPHRVAVWLAPRVRWPLAVLLATGAMMVISEPERTLTNAVFWVKLGLVLGALALSERQFRAAAGANEPGSGTRVVAIAVLLLWLGAILCGRWIAYVY